MKTIKQLFVVGAVIGAAGAANASYTIGLSDGGVAVKTGASYVAAPLTVINTTLPNISTPQPYNSYYVGSTFPTVISGQSTYDINIGGSGSKGYLGFSVNDVLEGPQYLSPNDSTLGSLFNVQSISVAGVTDTSYISGDYSWTSSAKVGSGLYVVTVDWTLSGVYNQYPSWLSSFDINTGAGVSTSSTGASSDVFITAVPEPGQAIAGVTLLGCGGLIFIGRRFMVKKA